MTTESQSAVRPLTRDLRHVRYFVLAATDGKQVIPEALGIFTGGIDGTYDNHEGTGHPAPPTPEVSVSLYDVSRERTLRDILKETRMPLQHLSLTDHQIIQMVRDHGSSLELDSNAVFFITEINGNYHLHQVRNFMPGMPKISTADYYLQKVQCEDRYAMRIVLPH